MSENITRRDLIEFLHQFLRPADFNRLYALARENKNCRLMFRMTQKINDIEHLIVDIASDNIFFRFVPDSIAQKPFSELTDADLIPDGIVFVDK